MKWYIILGIFIVFVLVFFFTHFQIKFVHSIAVQDTATGEQVEMPLKRCPFCGKNAEILVQEQLDEGNQASNEVESPKVFAITCSSEDGGCGCSTGFFTKPMDAVLAWNMRSHND